MSIFVGRTVFNTNICIPNASDFGVEGSDTDLEGSDTGLEGSDACLNLSSIPRTAVQYHSDKTGGSWSWGFLELLRTYREAESSLGFQGVVP